MGRLLDLTFFHGRKSPGSGNAPGAARRGQVTGRSKPGEFSREHPGGAKEQGLIRPDRIQGVAGGIPVHGGRPSGAGSAGKGVSSGIGGIPEGSGKPAAGKGSGRDEGVRSRPGLTVEPTWGRMFFPSCFLGTESNADGTAQVLYLDASFPPP